MTGVEIGSADDVLYVGDTVTLAATVTPDNADNPAVTWSSSDEDVASVDSDGKVTAISAGTADITVTTEDGSYTDSCRVTVEEPETAVAEPDFIAYQKVDIHDYITVSSSNVKFKSSNRKAATVSKKGIVTFKKAGGNVTITAIDKTSRTEVGSYTFDVKVPYFSTKKTSMSTTVSLNGFDLLNTAGVNEKPVWVSSKPSVVSVDADSGEITALSKGSAKIYAVYGAGSVSDKNGTRKKIRVTIKVTG